MLDLALVPLVAASICLQAQGQAKHSVGEVIAMKGARLTVKVSGPEQFRTVKLTGIPVVVEMKFTATEYILLWFRPGPTPPSSDLTLLVGNQVFAPVAMADDRPSSSSTPRDPVLMSELRLAPTGKSFIGWNFEGSQVVWWLFDVPAELQQAPRTASLRFDLGDQPQALLVTLK